MAVSELVGHTYHNYIGSEWIPSSSGKTFININPANTKEVLGYFQQSNEQDVARAVAVAKKSLSTWRLVPAPQRGEYIRKAADEIEAKFDELTLLLVKEVGKSIFDAQAEVQRTINTMRFLAGEATRLNGETVPSWQQDVIAFTKREPIGVVGVITPWNVPMAIAAWKLSSALICGCTALFKPSSQTPLCSLKLVESFIHSGLPEGVINFVTGPGSKVGNAMAAHPDIKAISFTGSNRIGNHINQLVAARGGRFQAEMGGKNPFVVLADADLDLACDHVIRGGYGESGQRCTATSRVIVMKEIAEAFIEKLLNKIKEIKVGNPIQKDVVMGPVVDQEQLKTSLKYIEIAKNEGAVLLTGGHQLTEGEYGDGFYVAPTLFRDVTPEMTIAQEEVFGPVICIMEVDDFEQAIDWANRIVYGLSSTIYTNDMEKAMQFINRIEAGITHVNMPTTYSEPQFPFGGVKATGLVDFYSEWKTVYIRPHAR